MKQTLRIGTRGSQLARWQADFVQRSLESLYPDHRFEQVIIKTEGDQDQHSSLKQIGGQGVFTKAIEWALLREEIDIAVHSLKDLPSGMDEGLVLGAVPERGPVEDVLVSRQGSALAEMPLNAKIATGSIRRQSQILEKRPDIHIADLRGNIQTRLNKLDDHNLDAIVMARAALFRLKIEDIRYHTFSIEDMIPAVGQGAIGIQIRKNDQRTASVVAALNHPETWMAVTAERALLHTLDSGCQFPVGAHGKVMGGMIEISGFVGLEDGTKVLKQKLQAEADKAEEAGRILAEKLIGRGALELLNVK